jgi:hypothetical protein
MSKGSGTGMREKIKLTVPTTMYHVSIATAAKEIHESGLHPQTPSYPGLPTGVYLFHDLENAEFFVEHMTEEDRDNYGVKAPQRIIYEVQTTGLVLFDDPAVIEEDEFQKEYPRPLGASYTKHDISPSRLRRL